MNRTLVLCLLLWFNSLWLSGISFAQDSTKIYTWEEALLVSPETVYRIDASKLKWDQVPPQLFTFTKLRSLDLSKNRLTEIPDEIAVLKDLKILDLSRNKFESFPVAVCPLTGLRKLSVARNQLTTIPSCIGYFSSLKVLDLWDNPIVSLPQELTLVTSLETVDLRGILFNQKFQDQWRNQMPGVTWYFDVPCKCLD